MPGTDAWIVWAAQIVNFLILVALLRKFLYRPVLEAITSRQQEISSRVEQADATRQEAEQLARACREREQELAEARDRMLAEARQDVETWKQEAIAGARAEVDVTQSRWWDALHRERERLLKELCERAGRQVHQVARDVLAELGDANLERRVVRVFLDRLSSWDETAQDRMRNGQSQDSNIIVTSALPLPDELQAEIANRLNAQFGQETPIQFEVDPDLICGVELQWGAQRISWNVAHTMETFEQNFAAALDHDHVRGLIGEGMK